MKFQIRRKRKTTPAPHFLMPHPSWCDARRGVCRVAVLSNEQLVANFPPCITGLCTTGRNDTRLFVGAVYDRAIFVIEWAKSAVIDRAYSSRWPSSFPLCIAASQQGGVGHQKMGR